MAQHQPTPVLALSSREEHTELVNRLLRKAGQAAYCHRIDKTDDLADALTRYLPHLLFVFTEKQSADIAAVAAVRDKIAPTLPIVAVGTAADEEQIACAINAGARDLVSVAQTKRLIAVALRELRSYRLEKALRETLVSANQYRRELKAVMAGSDEGIAYVQEGIIVRANPAWVELFGCTDSDELKGIPLMDFFDKGSQAALKGALMACAREQWTKDLLRVFAIDKKGTTLPVRLKLEEADFGNEPAVRISVHNDQPVRSEPEQLVVSTVHQDPMTGFYHRRQFIDLLTERLEKDSTGGVRALAYIRPDNFGEIRDEVGPLATEDVLIQIAEIVRGLTQENDICGRFGGVVFTTFIERGTPGHLKAWAENVVRVVSDHLFEINGKALSVTCTLGLSEVTLGTDRVESLVLDAERANKRGRQRGGNQAVLAEISDESTRIRRFDALWVERIRAALLENRFRLVHMPLANLNAQPSKMYDTVMRMIDEQGDEVAATTFIAAAERNGLLKTIDRWVIGSALAFCREHSPARLLVKLSKDSVTDPTLVDWIASQVQATPPEAGQVCFQVREEHALQYTKPLKALLTKLGNLGFTGAIEHFGIGRNSVQLLEQLPVEFVKIDGSILQNIETNPEQQERVRLLVEAAHACSVETVAERVEQASTMAVLFQLGIGYMQGHYVYEPEVVLAESRG